MWLKIKCSVFSEERSIVFEGSPKAKTWTKIAGKSSILALIGGPSYYYVFLGSPCSFFA